MGIVPFIISFIPGPLLNITSSSYIFKIP